MYAYMYEQTKIEFDVCTVERKDLNWYTHIPGISLCCTCIPSDGDASRCNEAGRLAC